MSAAISPATHRPYGMQRVYRVWAVPRSTFYQTRRPADAAAAKPRGPKPLIDDAGLLAAIQADLAALDRSSRAEGPRDSGWCLTGPSTVASCLKVGSPQPGITTS
jgi:hypothetical protein